MKKPRYFCEHCGAEVGRNAKVCPACGRFFSSVKCPRCGYSGEPGLFRRGCPVCGYTVPGPKSGASEPASVPPSSGPLPLWIYVLALAALVAALVVFWTTTR